MIILSCQGGGAEGSLGRYSRGSGEQGTVVLGFYKLPDRTVTSQLVVPSKFGERVMAAGHEALMSGHPGKGRIADRIMSNLYWPGALANIKRFCVSCDSCQRASPRGSTRKVSLVRGRSCPLIHQLVRGRSCPLVHWLVRGRSCPLVHRLVRGRSCPLVHRLVRGRSCPLVHWLVRAEAVHWYTGWCGAEAVHWYTGW